MRVFAVLASVLLAQVCFALSLGKSMYSSSHRNESVEVFAYRPLRVERIIVVMHGTLRNAEEYRDDAIEMGERFNAIILTPRFDAERFPSRRYQRGGILREDGSAAEPGERTYAFLPKIVADARRSEGWNMPYWVIGHSAGGQFVVRMAAFSSIGAERLVAANAGSLVFPTREMDFGYGFGKLPSALQSDDVVRAYLAAPLTLYQGTADDKPDEYFDQSDTAMKQGPGRFQRGKNCFAAAKELARSKGWKFNWRIVTAPGVPHDHTRMFNHPSAARALLGKPYCLFDPFSGSDFH